MAEECRRASEVDLVAFLDDPGGPEWAEFRDHVLACQTCAQELFELSEIEEAVRGMNPDGPAHPTAEQLTSHRFAAQRLPVEERQWIDRHLKTCHACANEVAIVRSLDLSRPVSAPRPAVRAAVVESESVFVRFLKFLRPVVLHPAFAYAIAALLAIPAVRNLSPSVPNPPVGHDPSASPVSPRRAAPALLEAYKDAYEKRDLEGLKRIWDMKPDDITIAKNIMSQPGDLLLVYRLVGPEPPTQGDQASVKFIQVMVRSVGEGRFETDVATYVAEIQRRGGIGFWGIKELRKLG